ncbi:MAG: protein-disulfide reductase DsbD family protein [Opitutus sp.]|nr:protein-disulfide reductase DsbD family protein [Opitutus sp.]
MLFRRLLACLCLAFASVAFGASTSSDAHVTASLVAAEQSIQPGRPFTVALRLVHEEHWHTYWINPGTGYVTSLNWKLPPGFSAGDIQWPAPIALRDRTGTIVGNGYEGETFLLVQITPPADLAGSDVTLKANADWLMCSDVCIPGGGEVSLTLPVSKNPPQPDAEWSEKFPTPPRISRARSIPGRSAPRAAANRSRCASGPPPARLRTRRAICVSSPRIISSLTSFRRRSNPTAKAASSFPRRFLRMVPKTPMPSAACSRPPMAGAPMAPCPACRST